VEQFQREDGGVAVPEVLSQSVCEKPIWSAAERFAFAICDYARLRSAWPACR